MIALDYRKLIADGVVVDPNYEVDEKGKLTFRKGVKRFRPGSGSEEAAGDGGAIQPTITDAKRKKRPSSSSSRRKRSSASDDDSKRDEDEDEDELDGLSNEDFVLGPMQDAMTLKPMRTPAISPFGHVLDYKSWLRLLKEKPLNTCPFTKQRVTRRDLVKLTKQNIEAYRVKILPVKFDVVASMMSKSSEGEEEEEET